jgi:Trm5-related predicted tRNA methylase
MSVFKQILQVLVAMRGALLDIELKLTEVNSKLDKLIELEQEVVIEPTKLKISLGTPSKRE